ncbi:hypothetical protein ACFL1N_12165 [Thermodesulfobacteriota bacterium]
MKIICPDCTASLKVIDDENVHCSPECGGNFKVLFSRKKLEPETPEKEVDNQLADPEVAGKMCSNHPGISAWTTCHRCQSPICKTCVFTFYEDYNLCPACASSSDNTMSPRRRKNMIKSFVFAGICTIFFIIFFIAMQSIQDEAASEGIATVLGLIILITGITGMSFGFSALDKRLKNPVSLWFATIWNIALVGIYILLCIIGLFML